MSPASPELRFFNPDDLIILGVDTEDDETHPLVDLDKARHNEIDPMLVASIVEHGVRQAVTVTLYGDRHVVVDGRRRVLHARVANSELTNAGKPPLQVKAIVEVVDGEHSRADTIIANNFRRQHSPVAQAKQIERLLIDGYKAETIATMMGISAASVSTRRKILACTDKVQQALDLGQINLAAASELSALSGEEQDAKLEEFLKSGGKKKGSAERIKDAVHGTDAPKPPTRDKIKKLLETEAAVSLDPQIVNTLQWVIGVRKPSTIKGLSACLKELLAPKKKEEEELESVEE